MNPQLLYEQAAGLHQRGNLAEAERLYLQLLAAEPGSPRASHFLGLIRYQQGRNTEALELIATALRAMPQAAEIRNMHGLVLLSLGRPGEALADFDKAISLQPQFAIAWSNRGNALRLAGRQEDALASFDKALALRPDYAEALNLRGMALWEMKRFEEALSNYDGAIAVRPDYSEALNNRGNTLAALGRFGEAVASFDRTLALRPGLSVTHFNRGHALQNLGRLEEALAAYDAALTGQPDFVPALIQRGKVLRDLMRLPEALASFDRALAIEPDNFSALTARAYLHWDKFRDYDPALRDLEQAVRIRPDHPYVQGDLLHLRMLGADWRDYDALTAHVHRGVRAGETIINPFAYQAIAEAPADLQACSVIYARDVFPARDSAPAPLRRGRAKIRLGYVSADYYRHATAYLMAGLFESHDRDRFEIIAFDAGRSDNSAIRKRLEAGFDRWMDIAGMTDGDAADAIRGQGIDILVNLNGYAGGARMGVFARRPAPIQVNYLGYPGTLGAAYMDYILADRIVIPDTEKQFYTEQVVTLPGSYQVNDSRRDSAAQTPTRAEHGLPEKEFVFCNFNQSYKITPAMFAIYMRLLNAVPGSILWLLQANERCGANLRSEAEKHGVAGERLVFAPIIPLENHLARLKLADLFIDSLPYGAHTTASDALWAGVPLVTCRGTAFAGRVGASLLHAAGMPELVTENGQDYEALILKLARDPARLQSLRQKLAGQRLAAPLFDTENFRKHVEAAYIQMWEIAAAGERPRGFAVPA